MAQTNRLDMQIRASNAPTYAAPKSGGPGESVDFFHVFTEGLNPGQVDWVYQAERELAVGTNEDLDFAAGGGLFESDNTAIAGTKLRALAILNEGPGQLEVGPPAAGILWCKAATDRVIIPPGGIVAWSCGPTATGIDITAVTADLLNITEDGTAAVTYKILAAGT